MLALYDKSWKQIDFLSTSFVDQGDKYVFWRTVADRAFYQKAFAMVWTSETWVRDLAGGAGKPIRELPIIGEQLHVVGADAADTCEVIAWNIDKTSGDSSPILNRVGADDEQWRSGHMFFIKPVVAAMKMAHANIAA